MQTFEITEEYVTLGQALKWAGIISTGGEARELLTATKITVNGERDERRGRKLYPGDVVEVPGEEPIQIALEEDAGDAEPVVVPPPVATASPQAPPRRRKVVRRVIPSGARTAERKRRP